MRQSYAVLCHRPAHHEGAPFRSRDEAELLVELPHRLVALLALGEEALEACLLRSPDLGALQGAGDPAATPVAPRHRQAVKGLFAVHLQAGVADDLVSDKRQEDELRAAARVVDLVRTPALEALSAGRARNVLVALRPDREHLLQPVRLLGE